MKTISSLRASTAALALTSGMGVVCAGAPLAVAQDTIEDETARLGTVTVTAQRMEENLQDVPVAVTALDGELLESRQVEDLLDLQANVPNISIATNVGTANGARVFMRGVGEDESRGAVEPAVGIYVDGIFVGRAIGGLLDVVDLEGIEVLRGPQGTLYGRNTIGGAIKLTSTRPQFENGGRIGTIVGNNGRYDVRGSANLQLADRTAIRVSGLLRERDGFHDLKPNGALADQGREVGRQHIMSFRASFLHEFNNDWSVYLIYDETLDRSDPIPDSAAPPNDADGDIFTIEPLPGTVCALGDTQLGCFTNYDQRSKVRGVSAEIDGTIGELQFVSLTGYRELQDTLSNGVGLPFSQATDQDQFSQEFTLSNGSESVFDWLVGAYYFTESQTLDSVFAFPFTLETSNDSYAIFGQGAYDVTDALKVTAGLRYTEEEKDFFGANLAPFAPFNTFIRNDTASFDNISFTLGADYRFSPTALGYAKYSTGFKGGGWSPDAFGSTAVFLPVEEETLDSFEVGLKTDLFDQTLRVNTAAFFNQYEGLQIAATVPGLGFTRFNVDESEFVGLEVEATWQVNRNFQIFGNLGLLESEYTSVTGDQARGLTNNGAGCAPGVDPLVDSEIIACARDLELKNGPAYKATLGGVYTQPLANGDLSFSADISSEDEQWSLVANSPPHARIDFDALLNARMKYQSDKGWHVALWGKNLTDVEYYRTSAASSFTAYASSPLTYGVDVGFEF